MREETKSGPAEELESTEKRGLYREDSNLEKATREATFRFMEVWGAGLSATQGMLFARLPPPQKMKENQRTQHPLIRRSSN